MTTQLHNAMNVNYIYVGPKGTTHNLGIFTSKAFKKGDYIFTLDRRFTRTTPTRESIQITANEHVLDYFGGYMNHACFPNTTIERYEVIAAQDIEVTSELTFDYRTTEDKLASPFVCECCRKEIK